MGKVTLLVTLGGGAFCRKSRRGDAKGEERDRKTHLGHGLQGRDAGAVVGVGGVQGYAPSLPV